MEKKLTESVRVIGQDFPRSVEEKEEDLLEYLYTRSRYEAVVSEDRICRVLNFDKGELNDVIHLMYQHGYLTEAEQGTECDLTELGKMVGRECLMRHQALAEFLQMTCGLEEDQAEENACRVEHVLGSEVIDGVHRFLMEGATYDRTGKNLDPLMFYEEGGYTFSMSMYLPEKRSPRELAEEFYAFFDTVYLEVARPDSWVYLRPKEPVCTWNIWYLDRKQWKLAKRMEKGYCIPASAFSYTISAAIPIRECDLIIGITEKETEPDKEQCRELNLHIW